jgi:hypothetical protein
VPKSTPYRLVRVVVVGSYSPLKSDFDADVPTAADFQDDPKVVVSAVSTSTENSAALR